MKKKFNFKIFMIVALTLLVFLYLILFNIKKNTKVEISAEVAKVGTNYVIVTDGDKKEYLLNTSEQYNIGDKINVVMKNLKKGSPYTGEIIKIDTVSRNVVFSITDEPSIKNEEVLDGADDSVSIEDNAGIVASDVVNDEQVIAYFNNLSNEIDNSDSFKETLKEKFVLIVDFLFYDGEIGEVTFEELSSTTKLKVLEIALEIDQKLENKFPGYKESISTTGNKVYTNIKDKVISLYLEITTNLCTDNEELCESAKEGLGELKRSFSLTWDFIKEAAGSGLEKLKSWYEIWREV